MLGAMDPYGCEGPRRNRGRGSSARASASTDIGELPPADPAWVDLTALPNSPLEPFRTSNPPRQYVDALLNTDFCGPEADAALKLAMARALSTQILPWLADYELFRAHTSDYGNRMSRSYEDHLARFDDMTTYMDRMTEQVGRLEGRIERMEVNVRRLDELQAAHHRTGRVEARELSLDERIINAQQLARVSRSPFRSDLTCTAGRQLPDVHAALCQNADAGPDVQSQLT